MNNQSSCDNKYPLILIRLKLFALFIALCWPISAPAADRPPPPVVVAPMLEGAPVLDGSSADAVWRGAVEIGPLAICFGAQNGVAKPATLVKVARDQQAIYLCCQCDEPKMDGLVLKSRVPNLNLTGDTIWLEDHLEVFITPLSGAPARQFLANPVGGYALMLNGKDVTNQTWRAAATIQPAAWTLEIMIPAASLDADFSQAAAYRFDIFRVRRVEGLECAGWAPVKGQFADLDSHGYLVIGSLRDSLRNIVGRQLDAATMARLTEVESILPKLTNADAKFLAQARQLREQIRPLAQPSDQLDQDQWRTFIQQALTLKPQIDQLWRRARLLQLLG